jgi:hypothetical protein
MFENASVYAIQIAAREVTQAMDTCCSDRQTIRHMQTQFMFLFIYVFHWPAFCSVWHQGTSIFIVYINSTEASEMRKYQKFIPENNYTET